MLDSSQFNPSQLTPELELTFLQTEDVSIAKLVLKRDGWLFESTGDAKRYPTDDVDLVVGHDLALSRALMRMAVQLYQIHGAEVLAA